MIYSAIYVKIFNNTFFAKFLFLTVLLFLSQLRFSFFIIFHISQLPNVSKRNTVITVLLAD